MYLFRHGVDGGDHLWSDVPRQLLEYEPAVELVSEGAGLGLPRRREVVNADLVPFQARPGVVVGVGGVDGADEVPRKAALRLQAGECLEGARRDDAAEVEHHRLYRHTLP